MLRYHALYTLIECLLAYYKTFSNPVDLNEHYTYTWVNLWCACYGYWLLLSIPGQDSVSGTHSSQLPAKQLDLPGCSNLVTQTVTHSHSRGTGHGPVRSQQRGILLVWLHSTARQQEYAYAVICHRLPQSIYIKHNYMRGQGNYTWGSGAYRLFWGDYRPESKENILL